MPYFFIVPAFVLYAVTLGGAILLSTLYAPAARFRPYLIAVLGWSSLGFLVSGLAYGGVLLSALIALRRFAGGEPSAIGGILMGIVVFVLPFVAVGVGLLGGAMFGIMRVRRRR